MTDHDPTCKCINQYRFPRTTSSLGIELRNKSKKKKMNRHVDRISNLPDSIIHNILSLLVDIKFVVQTCVLSKRWRYIWTSLPVLKISETFHYCHEEDSEDELVQEEVQAKRFFKFVDKVLNLRDDHSDIQKFHLEIGLSHPPVSKMHRWISTAVSHNVQKLKIVSRVQGVMYNFKAEPENGYEIPPCLCTCKSLTKLELELAGFVDDGDRIILPHEMSLPQLKSLHLCLEDMAFDDEQLTNRFFSSFPSLESLIVEMESTGFRDMNLHISLPKLKFFQFGGENDGNSEVKVKLHAPNLSSFIFNSYMSTSFTLENLPSLAIADIKICVKSEDEVSMDSSEICAEKKEIYAQHTTVLLRGIQNVKVLKLDDSVLKALGGAPDILNTQLPEFHNLQHLKLQTYLPRDCLLPIFYILKNSPNIESVSLPAQVLTKLIVVTSIFNVT
ncbi:hypothetical protein MKW92_039849 [Papaver armeniacum]|nr:hypothetical protein MKW92_039849 [Papaver armeniacum]